MPIIRGRFREPSITTERRQSLVQRLAAERKGEAAPGGPVIFEIPLPQPNLVDIVVIWEEWKDVAPQLRNQLIEECYSGSDVSIALALGLTYAEALEQGVLPYRVRLEGQTSKSYPKEEFDKAARMAGGFAGEGDVELRFPTIANAQEAIRLLQEQLPGTQWKVLATAQSSLELASFGG
jgi:hypothetical protein